MALRLAVQRAVQPPVHFAALPARIRAAGRERRAQPVANRTPRSKILERNR